MTQTSLKAKASSHALIDSTLVANATSWGRATICATECLSETIPWEHRDQARSVREVTAMA